MPTIHKRVDPAMFKFVEEEDSTAQNTQVISPTQDKAQLLAKIKCGFFSL